MIGGLDERFGIGLCDDDDLAERARRAGFELAVARDLFVHHFGSRTFVGNGIDAERLLAGTVAGSRKMGKAEPATGSPWSSALDLPGTGNSKTEFAATDEHGFARMGIRSGGSKGRRGGS